MIGTVAGDLRRSVEIHKHRIRVVALPCMKLPDRHCLAAEQNLVDICWYLMFQSMQPVQQAECRHRPDQRRDMVLIEHVHNGVWEHEIRFRNHN